MLTVDVRSDIQSVILSLERAKTDLIEKATVRALNRTATTVRAEAAKAIRARYNIKSSEAKDRIKVTPANKFRLQAVITASGRRTPLILFDAKMAARASGKRGIAAGDVTVRVLQASGRKVVKGSIGRRPFIATMKSGHVGVFVRTGGRRLPIRELFSVSLPQAFTQRAILAALRQVIAERFPVEMRRQTQYLLSKGVTGG